MFRGFGTAVNVAAVVAGSGIGVVVGHRLPTRTRDTVTDALGLVTLLIAALAATAVFDSVDAQLRHHSFRFDRGRFTEIRPRGAYTGSLAADVNDRGRVIGWVL